MVQLLSLTKHISNPNRKSHDFVIPGFADQKYSMVLQRGYLLEGLKFK